MAMSWVRDKDQTNTMPQLQHHSVEHIRSSSQAV
jgi:hypothetical protein